jgi:hypothetical protein
LENSFKQHDIVNRGEPKLATSPDKHALNLIFQKFGSSGILDGREHTAAQFD